MMGYNDYLQLSEGKVPALIGQTTQGGQPPPVSPTSIEPLKSLFGTAVVETAVKSIEKLPETRLNLTLAGTFTHIEASQASALIGESGRQSKRYFVGEEVPGNAELVEVKAGTVVLRRNGQDELLRLPMLKDSENNQPSSSKQLVKSRKPLSNTVNRPTANSQTDSNHPASIANQERKSGLKDRLAQLRASRNKAE